MRATHFLAATVLASLALTACSGDGDGDKKDPKAECQPVKGAGTVSLRDDRGALPAANVVSVTSSKGQYRKPLEAVDRVTRAVTSADVATVADAKEKRRAKAIKTALTDLTGKASQSVTLHLFAGEGATADAVADLYRAGLGGDSTVEVAASAQEALKKAQDQGVALVSLTDLAAFTDAKVDGQDLGGQLQSVATAALKKKLAVGSTGELTTGSTVLVATNVAAQQVTTVAELAKTCGEVTLVHTADSADATAALAKVYGFGTDEVDDVAQAIADGKAVAGVS